ncbi:MAG: polyprenyl synthetase family protein [Chloroflexales bacterium]|nr:polyprenyl synthetase family protein [Chloroflexales bacterium]
MIDIFKRAHIQADLAAVEHLLLERTESRSPLIAAAGSFTVQAGGKRLRAALVLLAARMGHYDLETAIHPAASAELIHAASLVHDDLVDQAARRRGSITVHNRWDNDVALMVGDYFFALAAGEMALSPDPRIITFYAQAVQTIVEGELSPVLDVMPFEQALNQYFYKTGCKTAALFEAACKAGMAAGQGTDEQIVAMGRYGYDLGMAFQIMDDVLDFIGDENVLGKPAGNDLRQGTITLPLIYAVVQGRSKSLSEIINQSHPSAADIEGAVAEVITYGGVERALADAQRYVEQAIAHLAQFPATSARYTLYELARFVVNRQS